MWTSVPQMPVRWIWISTSLIPHVGSGTSSQPQTGFGFSFDQRFHADLQVLKVSKTILTIFANQELDAGVTS